MGRNSVIFIGLLMVLVISSFQTNTYTPEINAAKIWFEQHVNTPYVPDWTTAKADTLTDRIVISVKVAPSLINFKWQPSSLNSTASMLDGTNRITIVKLSDGSYHAGLARFFGDSLFCRNYSLAGLNTLDLNMDIIKDLKFSGHIYFEDLQDQTKHFGLSYLNGIPYRTLTRQNSHNVLYAHDRICTLIDMSYQTAYFGSDGIATIAWVYSWFLDCPPETYFDPEGVSNWIDSQISWLMNHPWSHTWQGSHNNNNGSGQGNPPCNCIKSADTQPLGPYSPSNFFVLSTNVSIYNLDCNTPSLDGYISANRIDAGVFPISWEFTNNHVFIIQKIKIAGGECGYFVKTNEYAELMVNVFPVFGSDFFSYSTSIQNQSDWTLN